MASFDSEVERTVQLGVEKLLELYSNVLLTTSQQETRQEMFTVATFSRSSTILKILLQFLKKLSQLRSSKTMSDQQQAIRFVCAKSTPGDEGLLMQQDLSNFIVDLKSSMSIEAEAIEDEALHCLVRQGIVNVVVVGADCIMDHYVVNKIGTKSLAETCRETRASSVLPSRGTSTLCCADRWKLWGDKFPPPLEDAFECVPRSLFYYVLLPSALSSIGQDRSIGAGP